MNTFHQLPLQILPDNKTVALPTTTDTVTTAELRALNSLHKILTAPGTSSELKDAIPPPPPAVKAARSAQVGKLRDSANAAHRSKKYADAIRLYTLAIDMATGRPLWEPAALVRDELSALYANRAQSHIALSGWPAGALDAQCSVELKRMGNAKGWWRRGKCLFEMGRLDEAETWLVEGLDLENGEADLKELLTEVQRRQKEVETRRRA